MSKLVIFISLSILFLIACKTNNENTGYQNISMQSYLDTPPKDVVLLDVRTAEEYDEGHIAGSINIDYKASDFTTKLDALDIDKSYLLYCRSGRRSVGSCEAMAKKGFKNLRNIEGGYIEYQKLTSK